MKSEDKSKRVSMLEKVDISKLYFSFAIGVLVLFFLAIGFAMDSLSGDPAPIFVTFFMLFGEVGFIIGAAFHVGLFLLFNYYLIRRDKKNIVLDPLRTGLPSLIYILGIVTLSFIWWCGDGLRLGLEYQGREYVEFRLIMNVLGLIALLFLIFVKMRKSLTQRINLSSKFLMTYNFLIHASILLYLFPYLGEMCC